MEIVRDERYLSRVRGHPCLVCGRFGVQAHHLKMVEAMGLGLKVSDQWTVPLCFECHGGLHNYGDEQTFWDIKGVDPTAWANKEWNQYVEDRKPRGAE